MFSIAEDIINKSGVEFSILLPLIQQTIKKLEKNKAKNVQTGPARRKDTDIIQDHLTNIQDKNIREIYQKISENIIKETVLSLLKVLFSNARRTYKKYVLWKW